MFWSILAALALVAVATGVGFVWRAGDGRTRRGSGRLILPTDVALRDGDFGRSATLLQFSTEFCTRCPATRRVLGTIAEQTPGVLHVDVDLTHRSDLAARYSVLQTPTTFVLDAKGAVRVRIAGAPRPAAVAEALAVVLGGSTTRQRRGAEQ